MSLMQYDGDVFSFLKRERCYYFNVPKSPDNLLWTAALDADPFQSVHFGLPFPTVIGVSSAFLLQYVVVTVPVPDEILLQ